MSSAQEQADIDSAEAGTPARVNSTVRVGILMNGPDAALWVHQTIGEIARAEHLELRLLIIKTRGSDAGPTPPVLLRAWSWADRRLFKPYVDALALEHREYAVDTVMAHFPGGNDGEFLLTKNGEAQLKAARLDVILNFASGDVPPQIQSAARYGVWTFSSRNGGAPEDDYTQFRDVYEDNRICTLTLRAMSAGGEVDLYRSTFSNDSLSLYRNRNVTCWRKSQIFLRLLGDLYKKGWPAIQLSKTAPAGILEETPKQIFPGNVAMSWFVPRWSIRTSRRWLSNLAFSERWFIAYHDKQSTVDRSASLKMIIPPDQCNYADPFLYERDGKHFIFFEAEHALQPKNEIWFVELDNRGNPSEPKRALKREYNLSYPLIFDWEGETYLMPETSQNRSIEVYRAVEFPHRWELAGTLLTNLPAVDATPFERDGKLWLFTAGVGGTDLKCSELSLFYSDSLFGPWIPHPKNPIVCDIRRARPAGRLFYRGGELIRPGQDCSECYGYAISLNRIDVVSETDYCETLVGTIPPNWAAGLSATHTLNMDSRYEVLDGKCLTTRYGFAARTRELRLRWPAGMHLLESAKRDTAASSGLIERSRKLQCEEQL